MVIPAIGQKKDKPLLKLLKDKFGIGDVKGYIEVDSQTNQTAHPKIFAGGDCVRSKGEASTVMAVQDGKIAARGILKQLIGEHALPREKEHSCCAGKVGAHSH
jgi:glutamate synthase (NADPH/NADH) small chain